MKLIELTIVMCFISSYSWSLNTLFLDPSKAFSEFVESKIQTIIQKEKNNVSNNTPSKKIERKTIKPEISEAEETQERTQENDDIENQYYISEEEKNESDDTDSLLDSKEYEEIIFSDVFDSEYWDED